MIQLTSIIEFKINQKFFPWFQNFVFIGQFENVRDRKFTKSSEYEKLILNVLHRDRPSARTRVMGATKYAHFSWQSKIFRKFILDNVRTT